MPAGEETGQRAARAGNPSGRGRDWVWAPHSHRGGAVVPSGAHSQQGAVGGQEWGQGRQRSACLQEGG